MVVAWKRKGLHGSRMEEEGLSLYIEIGVKGKVVCGKRRTNS